MSRLCPTHGVRYVSADGECPLCPSGEDVDDE